MIVRISASIVREPSLNEYLEHLQRNEIPHYEAAPGLISVWLLQRPFVAYVELLIISLWHSEQALTRFLETQTQTPAATETYGSIQLEARNYTVLISGHGKVQEAGDIPPR